MVRLTIVYDNYVFDPGFRPGSGFACTAATGDGTLLFDAGAHISTLSFNLEKAGIAAAGINVIAISHLDSDHYGGLLDLLEKTGRPEVYVPAVFPSRYKEKIATRGGRVREVTGPVELLPHVFSTGQVGGGIKEQALALETPGGIVLVVACGHPSLLRLAEAARAAVDRPLHMIAGGFHLGGMEEQDLKRTFDELRGLGLEKVAPGHCSTDAGIAFLRREFGDGFMPSGAGKVIEVG